MSAVPLDTNDLVITENSLNPGTFIIALFLTSTGFLILHSETPYSLVNENIALFRTLWISSALMTTFSFNAVILMFFAKNFFLRKISFARFLQSFGTFSLIVAILCFIISLTTLCWSYSITSTLLHVEDRGQSIVLTLIIATIATSGLAVSLLTMVIYWFINRNKRPLFGDRTYS